MFGQTLPASSPSGRLTKTNVASIEIVIEHIAVGDDEREHRERRDHYDFGQPDHGHGTLISSNLRAENSRQITAPDVLRNPQRILLRRTARVEDLKPLQQNLGGDILGRKAAR